MISYCSPFLQFFYQLLYTLLEKEPGTKIVAPDKIVKFLPVKILFPQQPDQSAPDSLQVYIGCEVWCLDI